MEKEFSVFKQGHHEGKSSLPICQNICASQLIDPDTLSAVHSSKGFSSSCQNGEYY